MNASAPGNNAFLKRKDFPVTARQFLLGACHGLLLLTACAHPHTDTNLIVYNAKVWTGDPANPIADSFRIESGRFVAVGNGLEKDRSAQPDTQTGYLDARGARIVPGLIDAHLHLLGGGLQLSRLNLRDVPDRAAFIAALAERATQTPKGQWIQGGRWSTESWPDPAQPTRHWIDAVTPYHPVLLSRMDGHGALANSVALKLAGIDANGPADPPGGQIERDPATGEPTGILKDAAIDLVSSRIPAPSTAQLDAALKAAMVEANRHGITGVHTMSEYYELAPIDRARDAGSLTLRVRFFISEDNWRDYIDRAKNHKNDDMLRVCGFKQYADGSLGSRTAYMHMPYSDNPPDRKDGRGLPRAFLGVDKPPQQSRYDKAWYSELDRMCEAAFVSGLSIAIHAIGDEANRVVLNKYAHWFGNHFGPPNAREQNPDGVRQVAGPFNPPDGMRLRIEHAQHLLPNEIPRFARLGVVASMQPLHKADDARYAEKAIGPVRCRTSYAFRSLLDAGAHVAFGSDWPVVSLNPFLGVHAAVTARSLDGDVFVPEQSIRLEEALTAYTVGAAYAAGDEKSLGRIAPGCCGDFVILDSDILTLPPDELSGASVKATYLGGRQVWPK